MSLLEHDLLAGPVVRAPLVHTPLQGPQLAGSVAIAYHRRGFRPQTLLTSLLDPKAFPADELRELYHER